MSISADTLRRLSALRLEPEAMAEVLSIIAGMQAIDDARKEKDRDRKRAIRGNSKEIPETVHGNGAEIPADISPQVSPDGFPKDNNQTPSLTPSSPSPSSLRSDVSAAAPKKPKPDDREVLEILETCLSAETARDLVAHRKAKKSPMTAGAAKALAKSFVAFGDPEAAAAAMMANGWQGFNPEWMHNHARAGPAIPPQNDRRVYIGVDQQKQLLDEYYDRIEGKNREPAFKLIG